MDLTAFIPLSLFSISTSCLKIEISPLLITNMSSTSPSSTYNPSTFRSCHHITSALNSNAKQTILENYGLAVLVSLINSSDYNKYYNRKAHPHSHENRKKTGKVLVEPRKLYSLRADALKCKDCHTNCGTSFMCLQCPNVGCWSLNHASKHSKTSNHHFGKLNRNSTSIHLISQFIPFSLLFSFFFFFIEL